MAKDNKNIEDTEQVVDESIEEEAATQEEAVTEKPKKKKSVKDADAYYKEKVPVKLIKDKQHKDDLFVRVNGRPFYIKRGVKVMIPRYVAEVIDNKERQEEEALERSESLQIDLNDPAFS